MLKEKDVVEFDYLQPFGGFARRFGRVLSVRDTKESPVGRSKYRENDKDFKRSQLLVTLEHVDGLRKAYYIERTQSFFRYPRVIGSLVFRCARLMRKLPKLG